MKQVFIAHCTDPDQIAYNIEKCDVIEQPDVNHVIVETTEDGITEPLSFTLGEDAAEDLREVLDLFLQQIHGNYIDAMNQLKAAFLEALANAETLDASSGHDGYTEAEWIAQQGAVVSSVLADLGFAAQHCLIRFMKLAREEAD